MPLFKFVNITIIWNILFCLDAANAGQHNPAIPIYPFSYSTVPSEKRITCLCIHGEKLWVGTDGDGVYFLQRTEGGDFSKEPSFANAKVTCFGEGTGGLYVGTTQGLFHQSHRLGKFEVCPMWDPKKKLNLGICSVDTLAVHGGRLVATITTGFLIKPTYFSEKHGKMPLMISKDPSFYSQLRWGANGKVLYGLSPVNGIYAHTISNPEEQTRVEDGPNVSDPVHFIKQVDRWVVSHGTDKEQQRLLVGSKEADHLICRFNVMEVDDSGTLWLATNDGLWRLGQDEFNPVQVLGDLDIDTLAFADGLLHFSIGNTVYRLGGIGSGTFNPHITRQPRDKPAISGQPTHFEIVVNFDKPQLLRNLPEVQLLLDNHSVDGVKVTHHRAGRYEVMTPPLNRAGDYDLRVTLTNIDGKKRNLTIERALQVESRNSVLVFLLLAVLMIANGLMLGLVSSPQFRHRVMYSLRMGDWVVIPTPGNGLWVNGNDVLNRPDEVRQSLLKRWLEFVFIQGKPEHFNVNRFYDNCNTIRGVEFLNHSSDRLDLSFAFDDIPAEETHEPFRRQLERKALGKFQVAIVGNIAPTASNGKILLKKEQILRYQIEDYCTITGRYRKKLKTIIELFERTASLSRNADICKYENPDPENPDYVKAFWHALQNADIVFVASHGESNQLQFDPENKKIITTKELEQGLEKYQNSLRAKLVVFCSCLVGMDFIVPLLRSGVTCIAARQPLELDFIAYYGSELLYRLLTNDRHGTGSLGMAHRGAIEFLYQHASDGRINGKGCSQMGRFQKNANAIYIYGYSQMAFQFRFRFSLRYQKCQRKS